ncbi:MAG: hemolysin III family protein [Colwelliaceae bacterium]|jgi:hemolysin III|nr:hemolysin III family protein [Colwelliaceae bacterium]
MQLDHQYTLTEEIANSISHGIGTLLSVAALTLLVFYSSQQQDIIRITSFTIYGTSLIVLFLASTLYHALINPNAKRIFKLLDHCAIYLLIAGTYTPLMLITLKGVLGYSMMAVVWFLAILGIIFKIIFGNKHRVISVISYLGMGGISLICIPQLYHALTSEGLFLLCLGGAFYSGGIIFYLNNRIPFNHAIWHLFVLAGAICHFLMMWYYV